MEGSNPLRNNPPGSNPLRKNPRQASAPTGSSAHTPTCTSRETANGSPSTIPITPSQNTAILATSKAIGIGVVDLPVKLWPKPPKNKRNNQGTLRLQNVLHVPTAICNIIGGPHGTCDYDIIRPDSGNGESVAVIMDRGEKRLAYFKKGPANLCSLRLVGYLSGLRLGPSLLDNSKTYSVRATWDQWKMGRWYKVLFPVVSVYIKILLITDPSVGVALQRPRPKWRKLQPEWERERFNAAFAALRISATVSHTLGKPVICEIAEAMRTLGTPELASFEKAWVDANYGSEDVLFSDYGLDPEKEEDRVLARAVVRGRMPMSGPLGEAGKPTPICSTSPTIDELHKEAMAVTSEEAIAAAAAGKLFSWEQRAKDAEGVVDGVGWVLDEIGAGFFGVEGQHEIKEEQVSWQHLVDGESSDDDEDDDDWEPEEEWEAVEVEAAAEGKDAAVRESVEAVAGAGDAGVVEEVKTMKAAEGMQKVQDAVAGEAIKATKGVEGTQKAQHEVEPEEMSHAEAVDGVKVEVEVGGAMEDEEALPSPRCLASGGLGQCRAEGISSFHNLLRGRRNDLSFSLDEPWV
ncbi:hypothetical protein QBC34DRAFT_375792 [Podospora aff. communis PSN243]|uniref:Uncharacterized protein n=1 Tax=Podospora aff. communis PSN243 TaxID=3040156 RepID=A0AAV9H050_9PEZI|nr:hypothetical protein QBC34DRAFT_375792 [Podospora aff. communis PSN243]